MTGPLAFLITLAVAVVAFVALVRIANAVVGIERELASLREDLVALLAERDGRA